MEEAAQVRRAAAEQIQGVEPARLRETIHDIIERGSMAPGVLTLLSARAVDGEDLEGVLDRATGVQLIYEGLRLTRRLAREEPWSAGGTADIEIIAADVLVARGFYLLARTEAAGTAVATVRSFGRDQTLALAGDDRSLDRSLEGDVFELAVVAGTTAVGGGAPAGLREFANDLAGACDPDLPAAGSVFPETVTETLAGLAHAADLGAGEGVRPSADH